MFLWSLFLPFQEFCQARIWWLDKITGTIEFAILIPFFFDVYHIIKVKTSISINLKSCACWFLYCVWSLIYFTGMAQPFAAFSSLLWCICYLIKIFVVLKYRPEGCVDRE